MFREAGLWDDSYLAERHAWLFAVLELLKPRVKRLHDFVAQGRFFFVDEIEYDPQRSSKHLRGMAGDLMAFDAACGELETFDPVSIEAALRAVADARKVKAASLIHACRVAVTGKAVSPGLFEVLALLGRILVRERLRAAIRLAAALPR